MIAYPNRLMGKSITQPLVTPRHCPYTSINVDITRQFNHTHTFNKKKSGYGLNWRHDRKPFMYKFLKDGKNT